MPHLLISSLSQMRHAVMVVRVRTRVSLEPQPGWATSGNPSAMAACCSSQIASPVALTVVRLRNDTEYTSMCGRSLASASATPHRARTRC